MEIHEEVRERIGEIERKTAELNTEKQVLEDYLQKVPNGIGATETEVVTKPNGAQPNTSELSPKVLNTLANGPQSYAALMAIMEIDSSSLRPVLASLSRTNKIKRGPHGTWALRAHRRRARL